MKRLGIDVGSTTVKLVVTDENEKIIYPTNNGSYAMQYVCGYVFCGEK